ncbi:heparin lyase I family protein [Endozoicomonas atrinae]|uniref:heparin lyase I family protein n=1 Tax=Endozoicomonas atrinae TaxID=1333660 RepID=UPI000ABC1183|nr:heparin lyase I family protein [Endozoicomonas atrinae]
MKNRTAFLALVVSSVPAFFSAQALAAPPLPESRDTLVEVRERYNIQLDVVEEKELLAGKMLPVGANKPGYHIWEDRENRYNNQPSYHFYMKDGKTKRVELSTIYTTAEDIEHLNRRELKEHNAAKSIYHFGTGMVERGEEWIYEYGLWLPSSMDETTQGIISQWHGTADRTTILTPEGEVITYSLEDFNKKVLTKMEFKQNVGMDPKTGKPNGYFIDQGGYPPLSLKMGAVICTFMHGQISIRLRIKQTGLI